LAICTVKIVPFENDLCKGGTTHKINIARYGGMIKATKDSYKRVYKEDGTHNYPRVPANKLRQKYQEYYENWEITGSKDSD